MAFTIDFEELDTYPRADWNRGEFSCTRYILTAWSTRDTLIQELDANPQYPYKDGPAEAYIRRVGILPFGVSDNPVAGRYAEEMYDYCLMTIFHSTEGPHFLNNQTWVEESFHPSMSYQKLPATPFMWYSGDSLLPNEAPLKALGSGVYRAIFHRLSSIPAWALANAGYVNLNAFATLILSVIFPPDTLRWDGASIYRRYTIGKLPYFDVVANFSYNPYGHNTFWNSREGSYQFIYYAQGPQIGQRAYVYPPVTM